MNVCCGAGKPIRRCQLITMRQHSDLVRQRQGKKRSLAATLWGEEEDGAGSAKLTEDDVPAGVSGKMSTICSSHSHAIVPRNGEAVISS